MSNLYKELEVNGKSLKIYWDDNARNPRTEFDPFGTFIMYHQRYSFGDNKEFPEFKHPEDLDQFFKETPCILMEVYMYDHSGITIATHPFGCRWDSGKIGYIFVTQEKARQLWNWKRLTKKRIKQVEEILKGEIEILDHYLTGEVYGYVYDEDGKEYDSCWGFYGIDSIKIFLEDMFPELKNQL